MSTLVFDIETIGEDWDKIDKITQDYLTRWAKRESFDSDVFQAKVRDIKEGLGFSPLTGEVVALGILDVKQDKGAVYFQAPDRNFQDFEEEGIKFKTMSEQEILQSFWEIAKKYSEFISFNGRSFDVPYLMIRSAIHKIRPSKNLMSNRYANYQDSAALHIDLLEQFTFYGAVRKKPSLHLLCRAFGIKSPKEGDLSGEEVGAAFKEGRYKEIALYNAKDLRATRELYLYWEKYLKF